MSTAGAGPARFEVTRRGGHEARSLDTVRDMETALAIAALVCSAVVVPFVILTWVTTRRADRRDGLRSDVAWAIEVAGTSAGVRQVGRDEAFDVLVLLDIDEESLRVEVRRVSPDETVAVTSRALEAERRDATERWAQWAAEADLVRTVVGRPPPGIVRVDARVTWRSASGAWASWTGFVLHSVAASGEEP